MMAVLQSAVSTGHLGARVTYVQPNCLEAEDRLFLKPGILSPDMFRLLQQLYDVHWNELIQGNRKKKRL